jgi:hypothetical protein
MPDSVAAILIPAFALLLAGLAVWFAWRQWNALAWLGSQTDLADDDRSYHRRMIARRLLGCVLMLALAAMLA